jgi:hypothetical protein
MQACKGAQYGQSVIICSGIPSCIRCYRLFSNPKPESGEVDEGEIAHRQFVIAGGGPPILPDPADQTLHNILLAVQLQPEQA